MTNNYYSYKRENYDSPACSAVLLSDNEALCQASLTSGSIEDWTTDNDPLNL